MSTAERIADDIIQAITILTQDELTRSSTEANSLDTMEEPVNLLEADPFAKVQITQKIVGQDIKGVNENKQEVTIVPFNLTSGNEIGIEWDLSNNHERLSLLGIDFTISTSIGSYQPDFGVEIEVLSSDYQVYKTHFDSSEMLGNIKNFKNSFQKKVFEVSHIVDINKVAVVFYNRSTVGTLTVHDFNLIAGHSIEVNENSDRLVLFPNTQNLLYTTNEMGVTSLEDIKLDLRFVYQNEAGKFLSVTDKNKEDLPLKYQIRWYKTSSGATPYGGDIWGGGGWSYFTPENLFKYTVSEQDISADYEWIQFKAVVIDDEKGGVIEATSQAIQIKNQKVVQASYLKNDQLKFLDGKNGGYPFYAFDSLPAEGVNYELNLEREIKYDYFTDFTPQALYDNLSSIKWYYTKGAIVDKGVAGDSTNWIVNTIEDEDEGYVNIHYIPKANTTVQETETEVKTTIENVLTRRYTLPTRRIDNTKIGCEIIFKNGQRFQKEKEISLAVNGAAGTDNSIIIRLLDADKNYVNAIDALSSSEPVSCFVEINIYDVNGNNITDGVEIEVSGDNQTNTTEQKNIFELKVDKEEVNVIKVACTIKKQENDTTLEILEYYPIPLCATGYKDKLYQGPTKVTYDSSGSNPVYNKGIVTILGESGVTSSIEINTILKNAGLLPNLTKGIFTPKIAYDKLYETEFVIIKIENEEGSSIWKQPIIIEQNRYFSRIINEWDGKMKIDEAGNYILTSAYVAGGKDANNAFTGAILGELSTITEQSTSKTEEGTSETEKISVIESGLFGYSKGTQTFGFKTDGTAFIGGSGRGRISFDGNGGVIESNGYKPPSINEDGTISSYGAGSQLNLQDGSFVFADGRLRFQKVGNKFELALDGKFNAVESTVGGFNIATNYLTTGVNEGEIAKSNDPPLRDWDFYTPTPNNDERLIPDNVVIISSKKFAIWADNRPANAYTAGVKSNSKKGWRVLVGANFGIAQDGMAATYAKITIANIANAEVAGFTLKDGAIYAFSDKSNIGVGLRVNADSIDTNPLFAIGIPNDKDKYWIDAPFRVFKNGRLEVNTITIDSVTESIYRNPSDGVNGFALVTRGVGVTDPVLAIGRPYAGKREDGTLQGWWDDAPFKVYEDGKFTVVNAQIQGGTIGNLKISANGRIYNGTFGNDESIFVSGTPVNTNGSSIFGVNGHSNVWYMVVGSRFGVQTGGKLFAKDATLKNSSFYKENTVIGADGSIYINTSTMSGPTSGFLSGIKNWLVTIGSRFGVADTGLLWAKDAYFKNVTLNEGTISNVTISDATIENGTISNVTINEGAFQAKDGYYLKFKNAQGKLTYGLTIEQGVLTLKTLS